MFSGRTTKKIKIAMMKRLLFSIVGTLLWLTGFSQNDGWYTQGDFSPRFRIKYTIENTLNISRESCPVVITRDNFPLPDIHEMWVTVVDPLLEPAPEPSAELIKRQGGHQLRKESNGHAIFHQLDDLDKDGIWDELFFQVNLKPKEKRTLYIYIGENIRGWNPHRTHADIASYCRHLMPFWESENVGWKIWFANSVDVFAKRKPLLMADRLYMENMDGYGVFLENPDYGTDIQSVDYSFGGGAICLYEFENQPEKISIPRFTPVREKLAPTSMWNAGQISDTRYAYEVIVNGPLRSIIRIKTMNWNSGNGFYEYNQYYTAYAGQSYCTSKVIYTKFFPNQNGVLMGCGVRKKPGEDNFIQKGGMLISSGPEDIKDPQSIDDRDVWHIPLIGIALIVKDKYLPQYQFIKEYKGNHTFRLKPDSNNSYEYMLIAGWSEGVVYNTKESFNSYAEKCSLEFNNPVIAHFNKTEQQ
jgi:hypothetical protein